MRQDTRGFTLVEVLVSVFLLGIVMLSVGPLFVYAIRHNAAGADLGAAGAAAVDRMEWLRRQPYASLDAGGSLTSDAVVGGTAYFDRSDPDFVVRWVVTDNATGMGGKRVSVRATAIRQVVGRPKQVTVVSMRAG